MTRHSPTSYRRPSGFTLLEVLLALAISVILLSALYAAIHVQLRQAQAGRDLVEQSTLARALTNRINQDVASAVTLVDPARFRRSSNSGSGSGGGSGGGTGSGSSAGGTTTPGTTTPGTTTPASGANSGNSGSSNASSASDSSNTSNSSSSSSSSTNATITLPLGIQGDNSTLNIYMTKVPREAFGATTNDAGIITSDLRRISYWLADGGLARSEAKVITSSDVVNNQTMGSGEDAAKAVIAPEVKSLAFRYFDGTTWEDTWDSTATGSDGVTPMGSPRLIEVTLEIAGKAARPGQEAKVKKYVHVIAVQTASGPDPTTTGGGATP
jgi:prepilin-type N-terminal cleavage/methylation domain-containing protein